MQQTQNFFPENNSLKQKAADYISQKSAGVQFESLGKNEELDVWEVINWNQNSVRHFDLTTRNSDFRQNNLKKNSESNKLISAFAVPNSIFTATGDFSSKEKLVQEIANKPEDLLDLLLYFLDQIVYLNEISEKIEKLDFAVQQENTALIKRIAQDFAEICSGCEMFSASAALQELARLKTESQMKDAAFLCKLVRKEFKSFRLSLRENLSLSAKQIQFNNLKLASKEMN